MDLTLIAAVGANNELGKDNNLIWHIPEDMNFFKENTIGKPIVMGINTLKSLPKRLPNRKHIVLTHQNIADPEIVVFHTIDDLLEYLNFLNSEIMVIGGAQIYKQMIGYANKMLLTKIEQNAEADTFFPTFKREEWKEQVLDENTYNNIPYKHLIYTKKREVK